MKLAIQLGLVEKVAIQLGLVEKVDEDRKPEQR
jgi:hypothetical protein